MSTIQFVLVWNLFFINVLSQDLDDTNSTLTNSTSTNSTLSTEEQLEIRSYIEEEYETKVSKIYHELVLAEWSYHTDIKNETKRKIMINATVELANFNRQVWEEHFKYLNPFDFDDEELKRLVGSVNKMWNVEVTDDELRELTDQISSMTNIYSTAKVCPYSKKNCNVDKEGLSLEFGIKDVLSTSRNYEELKYMWKAWRDATGAKIRPLYKKYVSLSNTVAHKNGYCDAGEVWRASYGSFDFNDDVWNLWTQLIPLYKELHTYVRRKLKSFYGDKMDDEDELIPAHLLGNMWGQTWINIEDIVIPFPEASTINITDSLIKQNYTVRKMFELADDFFQSLGLNSTNMTYDERNMITKPKDREVNCHATAWDLYNGEDYRITMCTKLNMEDFISIHHEMGHIQYFMLYSHLPVSFRSGANPGFHEAIGDTIGLFVTTPQHLEKINLLENYTDTYESNINFLMSMALENVAFLPFALILDMWRWDVFNGNVTEDVWNEQWWELRKTVQGMKPPVDRNENDFDPGSKYHTVADYQFISYFVSHVLQFQFFKAFCIAADQFDPNNSSEQPLHKCDIYESEEAGNLIRAGLSLGSSKNWSEVLEIMTGEMDLSAEPLLEYFQPLYEYLKRQNDIPIRKPYSKTSVWIAAILTITCLIVLIVINYYLLRKRKT